VSYSSAGFEDRSIDAALDAIAAAGFRYTELCARAPHVPEPPTGATLIQFRDSLSSRGLQVSAVHGPTACYVLGAPDETWRQQAIAVLEDHIRFAAAIGAPSVVIHPVPDPVRVTNAGHATVPGYVRDAVLCSLDDLLPIAEDTSVRMLLENLPYQCAFPFLTMRELRPLTDGYSEAHLGLVVDTGHAHVIGSDPMEEIRAAGPRLQGTHLQDAEHDAADDVHWVPTHGDLDWEAIAGTLFEVSYAGPWTFEVHRGRYGETAEDAARQCLRLAGQWGLSL